MSQFSYIMSTSAGTIISQATFGGVVWSNDTQASIEDTSYADAALTGSDATDYLDSRKYVGAPTLPSSAVITGVLVELLCYCDVADAAIITDGYLSDNSIISSSVESGNKPMPVAPSWADKGTYYGGDGIMFGLSAAGMKTLITQKNFGIQFAITETLGLPANVYIDDSRITVYYDIPGICLNLLGCGA